MNKKTKKTKKTKKKLHYFTLEENIEEVFEKYVEDNYINKSKLIEGLIIQYLTKNNINLDD